MACIEEFEVTIPSDYTKAQAVQERIIQTMERLEYPQRDVFGVRLALEEALVNAIKHGNRVDPNKSVHVGCRLSRERIYIEVTDEGPGFRLDEVPDPTDEINLEKPSGRGIMLMRSFMTDIRYNDRGNCCILEKARSE